MNILYIMNKYIVCFNKILYPEFKIQPFNHIFSTSEFIYFDKCVYCLISIGKYILVKFKSSIISNSIWLFGIFFFSENGKL